MLDKELGYVAMSRHRDVCELYCSEHQIKNQIERAAAEHDIEATPSMVSLADKIAEKITKANPASPVVVLREQVRTTGDRFLDVRDFLNNYANTQILDPKDPLAGFDHMATLKELARALTKSNAKDTTLDYSEVEREMPTTAPNTGRSSSVNSAGYVITVRHINKPPCLSAVAYVTIATTKPIRKRAGITSAKKS